MALYISKAFDRVSYSGLLHKLQSYGISGQIYGLTVKPGSSGYALRWTATLGLGRFSDKLS